MLLISTGKATVLSDFADLETISTYKHRNAETTDFQFYPGSNVFVEVNKKSGIEIMRVKTNEEIGAKIQKILALKIENAYCVGCAHQSSNEIALGLSNGQVRVYNYRNSEMLRRFAGEKMNSVVYVDYNAADDYIAAAHENGLINIYGNKTHAKLESINFESQPLLAKFHPTKRFHLSTVSQKGEVVVYDTSAKRKVFLSKDSHSAPCRDCTWSMASPDTLISVGYDCVINIFDTRRKGSPTKLTQKYPLSTVALAECGRYFCVGNLKGGLATYDMRNLKTELSLKKVHDGAVIRVAFVPELRKDEGQESFNIGNTINSVNEEANVDDSKSSVVQSTESVDVRRSGFINRGQRDSFCDFIDFQMDKGVQKTSSRVATLTSRDSFDWENLGRKPSSAQRGSIAMTGSNLSPIKNDDTEIMDASIQNSNSQLPLRERNFILSPAGNKLDQIKEEQHHEGANQARDSLPHDKENTRSLLELQEQQNNFSTPISAAVAPQVAATKSSYSPNGLNEISKQIENLRSDMNTRFNDMESRIKELESDFNFEAERNKWQIFSQANDLYCKQFKNIEDIREAMMFLLQTDPFVQEFSRLREENQKLKNQLESAFRKN